MIDAMNTPAGRRLVWIPGQKKSGTTTLHTALASACPDMVDIPKESGVLALGPAAFKALFAKEGDEFTLIDATTTYFKDGAFPENLRQNIAYFEEVQVLLMHRPEGVRLSSHYRHALNFDGVSDPLDQFLTSGAYLDHADLTAMYEALKALGVLRVRMVDFAELTEPAELRTLVEETLGYAVPEGLEAGSENAFGSREVIPGPLEALVSRPEFQIILRPLLPSGLRAWVKKLVSKSPVKVAAPDLDAAHVRTKILEIDAQNAALKHKIESDIQTQKAAE